MTRIREEEEESKILAFQLPPIINSRELWVFDQQSSKLE